MRGYKEHFLINISEPDAPRKILGGILRILSQLDSRKPLLVICIGTDRSTGDSLGPLVGTMLKSSGFKGTVFGTLDNPVHAGNLEEVLLSTDLTQYTVLGVDACLGLKEEVGSIIVKPGSLKPGLGVKKTLPPVGDLHIAGVVNVGGFMEYMVLQNTRLSLVMKMARAVALSIISLGDYVKEAPGGRGLTPEALMSVEPRQLLPEAYDPLR